MNGVHDMGGMHGFGPVQRDENEPVFHEPWEGRMFGMQRVVGARLRHRPGDSRYELESLDPAFYLNSTYYERWLETFVAGLISHGFITEEELTQRIDLVAEDPDAPLPRTENPTQAQQAVASLLERRQLRHQVDIAPRFSPGDAVRARNIHPRGHTRMPRYVRGKQGVIMRCHGVRDVEDYEPGDPLPPPQPVYSVRFDMQELWGESAEPGEQLFVDLWESHLEPA